MSVPEAKDWLAYANTKYPLGSALPDSAPDADVCANCISIAENAVMAAKKRITT